MARGILQQVKPNNRMQAIAHKFMVSFCGALSVGLIATASLRASSAGTTMPPVRFVAEKAVAPVVKVTRPVTVQPVTAQAVEAQPAGELLRPVDAKPQLDAKRQAEQTVTFGSIARPETKRLSAAKTRHIRMMVTAYCPCKICCGRGARGITASGKRVSYDGGKFVAADTDLLPFGTKLSIPGYHDGRPVEVIDTGSAIEGKHIDVFFPSHKQAKEWGVQYVDVTVARDAE